MKYGVYIHVPFCRKKCDYCDFYSQPVSSLSDSYDIIGAYTARVVREIEKRFNEIGPESVDTIYFGGGTPSILEPQEVALIVDAIKGVTVVDDDAEISLEVNPEDAKVDKLKGFVAAGINRTILGIQTLNSEIHKILGRATKLCTMKDVENFFSVDGLDHCVDVITGVPEEKEVDLLKDFENIISMNPDHISAYTLTIENNTPLADRIEYTLELEEMQRRILKRTMSHLQERGYRHYEISNYCRPGKEARHNMKYWHFLPYIGVGAGAHSFYKDQRFINTLSVDLYIASNSNGLHKDERSPEDAMAELFLTGLRLLDGISLQQIQNRLEMDLPEEVRASIDELVDGGLLEIENDDIVSLSDEGIFWADTIIYRIVEPLL